MWRRLGLIFRPEQGPDWMASHACTPTAFTLDESRIRLLFAPRDAHGRSHPAYIDIAAEDPRRVLDIGENPVMALGERGTFDDDGIMPCSIARTSDGALYLYYVGWNPSVSVPYRNAIGLAVSRNDGRNFERVFPGAVVDRSRDEPFFTASPCVFRDGDLWRLWYASTLRFLDVDGRVEPLYTLRYAESENGIDWVRFPDEVIPRRHSEEALARPSVIYENGRFRMWFCHRGSRDYRDGADSYAIGYAESADGKVWERDDAASGFTPPDTGFDSRMQAYPNVLRHGERFYLFYNGDGFGREGIGCAVWENDR